MSSVARVASLSNNSTNVRILERRFEALRTLFSTVGPFFPNAAGALAASTLSSTSERCSSGPSPR